MNEGDVLTNYLNQRRPISISLIFMGWNKLQTLQIQLKFIPFHEIVEVIAKLIESSSLSSSLLATRGVGLGVGGSDHTHIPSSSSSSSLEIQSEKRELSFIVMFYSGLLYEACLVPRITSEGPGLMLNPALLISSSSAEEKFLTNILQVLITRNPVDEGRFLILVEEFKQNRKWQQSFLPVPSETPPPIQQSAQPQPQLHLVQIQQQQQQQQQQQFQQQQLQQLQVVGSTSTPLYSMVKLPPPSQATTLTTGGYLVYPTKHLPDESENLLNDFNYSSYPDLNRFVVPIEKQEAVIAFLAHIRKSGMDIIFPQSLYDQMMLIFYIAVKCNSPLAHRELMDLIVYAQQSKVLGNELETISKTKVRGILALLKNAHSLHAAGGNGDSMKLHLGKGVTSFKVFREKHDAFINRCLSQQHMFLPVSVKGEILWQGDERSIFDRCENLKRFEPILEDFFVKARALQQTPSFPAVLQPQQQNQFAPPRPSFTEDFDSTRAMMMRNVDKYGMNHGKTTIDNVSDISQYVGVQARDPYRSMTQQQSFTPPLPASPNEYGNNYFVSQQQQQQQQQQQHLHHHQLDNPPQRLTLLSGLLSGPSAGSNSLLQTSLNGANQLFSSVSPNSLLQRDLLQSTSSALPFPDSTYQSNSYLSSSSASSSSIFSSNKPRTFPDPGRFL